MISWTLTPLTLDLLYTWKISRNATDQKTNLIATLSDGSYVARGEAAPNIRYNETPELLLEQFGRIEEPLHSIPVEAVPAFLETVDLCSSLRFGIESAAYHFLSLPGGLPLHELLHIPPPQPCATSFTIPIMDPGLLRDFYRNHGLHRFPFIKIKIGTDEAFETIRHLSSFCDRQLMIDANEAFNDVEAAIIFLEKIRKFRVEFVEQPLPSRMNEEALYMKKYVRQPLFADESITKEADFSLLCRQFDGVNIKLMKAGGYLNAIRLIREAEKNGMKSMIGCMVETTLGISSGLQLAGITSYADLDSFLLVRDEPFRMVKEEEGKLYFNTAER